MVGITTMAAAQEYWWLAPVISFLALAAVIWFQWGQHKVRAIRSKRPFEAHLAHSAADQNDRSELHIPPNTEVHIAVRIRPKLQYRQLEIVFGFFGDNSKRPIPLRVFNSFVKIGVEREQHPNTNTNHYIDHDDRYHIKTDLVRSPPNTHVTGFVVQTREPGTYPVLLELIIDCGEAKPRKQMKIIVDEPPSAHGVTPQIRS
jgi:hypothetical protein